MSDLIRATAFGGAIVVAAASLALATERPTAMDFVPIYAAARLVASGHGAEVLDRDAIREQMPAELAGGIDLFVHPPAVALLLAPLGALPFQVAFMAMALVNTALLALSIVLLAARSGASRLAIALAVVAPPSALAVAHGQTSPLVLTLVVLATRLPPAASGILLGLTVLRPQTAPLLLLIGLTDKERRGWTVAGALAVVLASIGVVGADGAGRYLGLLLAAAEWSRTGEYGLGASLGWSGILVPLGFGGAATALSLASLALGAIFVLRSGSDDRTRVAALWSVIASPHALMHDAILLYPVMLVLARKAAWDAVGVITWVVHLSVAPVGMAWSIALAILDRPSRSPLDHR